LCISIAEASWNLIRCDTTTWEPLEGQEAASIELTLVAKADLEQMRAEEVAAKQAEAKK
jgi:hypothetical protein